MYSSPGPPPDRFSPRPWDGLGPGPVARPARSPVRTVALVVLPFVVSGLVAAGIYFAPIAQVALAQTGQQLGTGAAPAVAAGSPFTMLLLGSDDDSKFQGNPLTQSMILVRVDPASKSVTMFSIPRDLYVPISGSGSGKIDQAYEQGGPDAAVRTVENDFDVRVDYWAWIGLTGLVQLVDQVGGVDLSPTNPVLDDAYPNDVNSNNPYGTERIAVLPGPQHMDGTQVLQYVRSRHDDIREDFGRSFRQQQVLIALRSKAKELNAADLPGIVGSFQGKFKTSMGLEQMRELLPLANQIQPGSIKQVVLVGSYTRDAVVGGQDVLLPNMGQIQSTVHQTFPAR
jgi:LCP family protein required for cell wall assembly